MQWLNSSKVFLIIAIYSAFGSSAQNGHCGSSEVYNQLVSQHPEILQKQQELDQFIKQYSQSIRKTEGQVYIIPIVFHILHNYGPENISDDQVIDAVQMLNEDYRKLNADTSEIVTAFKGVAANCEIEFRLANIDPDGNCTNGIDRIISSLTYKGDDDAKLNQWDPHKYLNIWSIKLFDSSKFPSVAGYSYFPSSAAIIPDKDGVIILSNYIGRIGTGDPTLARALTHEIGHYLNLAHPWGFNNDPGVSCGDDDVTDTPETKGWKTCSLNHSAVCDPNIQENIQNYMDYSYCDRMFTEGQKSRMRTTLNSTTASRNNLWTTANLIATGTNTTNPTVCTPIADFQSDIKLVCTGGSKVYFKDLSWKGKPTSWSWYFEGGTPSYSTLSGPSVQYAVAGTYNVTLVTANSSGTATKIRTEMITAFPDTARYSSWQYSDSFENDTFPNTDWSVQSSAGQFTWSHTNAVAAGGGLSVMVSNFNKNDQGDTYEMVSPSIDLSTISEPALHFKVANAQRTSTSNDMLEVSLSLDCGQSWILRYVKIGNKLSTIGVKNIEFYPASLQQWREEVVGLSSYYDKKSVYFKFKFTSGNGNNIYIDDINLNGPSGISETEANLNFSIFPNPADGSASLNFYIAKKQNVTLKIYDVLGKEAGIITKNETLEAGDHNYIIQRDERLRSGIYIARLTAGHQDFYKKIVFR